MRPRDIHHIGHAVVDLEAAVDAYERLFGAVAEHRETVPAQGVEAVSLRVGSARIELLRPLGADTPVGRFMVSRGPGMHHIAYRVDDVRVELARLGEAGVHLIDTEPHTGLFGLQVAFLHPDAVHGVLTELVTDG